MRKIFILLLILILFSNVCATDKPVDKLVFGVSSVLSAEETVVQYKDLAKYISKRIDMPTDMVYSSNYMDMNSLVDSGRVQFASICTGALLHLNDINLLVLPVVNGKSTYNSYIIVNKNSKIKDLSGLAGKTFAFTDPISNTGTLYPKYIVAKTFDKSAESFFQRTFYTLSHDRSIYLVNKNVVDGAAVDHLIYEYIKDKRKEEVANIDIIHISPDFMSPPFVTSSSLSKEMAVKIRDVLVNMHKDKEGADILASIGIERFVIPKNANWQFLIDMKQHVDSIK